MSLQKLRDDGWRRLLTAARRRLEATGGSLTGSVFLREPTEAERRVVIGITGAHRSAAAARLRVPLTQLDSWLRDAYGLGLVDALSTVDGEPLRDRPADRRREEQERQAALATAGDSRHAPAEWFQGWLDQLSADGTLTRIVRRRTRELAQAVAVLDRLDALAAVGSGPGPAIVGVPLPVLAERAVGDTKGLSSTPVAALVLRALAIWQGVPAPATAEDERALWDHAGVIVDDLSSQVLVLNLPARGELVARWLTSAASESVPFRLTLQHLNTSPLVPVTDVVYVCENPAILRAAAGRPSAPLICTEGVASVACRRLVAAAASAGAAVMWRNDFDWPGLRMTASALERFEARPWRMSAADYLAAGPGATPLRGAPATSPWDPDLAIAMSASGRSVMEERLLHHLLADLR